MSTAERSRDPKQFQIAGPESCSACQHGRREQMNVDVSDALAVECVALDEVQHLGGFGDHRGRQVL